MAFANSKHRLSGKLECGGQDHFYLEGQIAMTIPQEDNNFFDIFLNTTSF